jgi:predicted ATPase
MLSRRVLSYTSGRKVSSKWFVFARRTRSGALAAKTARLLKFKDAQFIISSHSPILLGYPEAQIVSFDREKLQGVSYEDLPAVQIARRFLNRRE